MALYSCEAWNIGKGERKLEAFEKCCYRKLLKISWVDKVTNEEVLNLVKEKRSLNASIKRYRDRLIGHTLIKGTGRNNTRKYSRGTQKERQTKIRVCEKNYR